jgi:hypothetical protein
MPPPKKYLPDHRLQSGMRYGAMQQPPGVGPVPEEEVPDVMPVPAVPAPQGPPPGVPVQATQGPGMDSAVLDLAAGGAPFAAAGGAAKKVAAQQKPATPIDALVQEAHRQRAAQAAPQPAVQSPLTQAQNMTLNPGPKHASALGQLLDTRFGKGQGADIWDGGWTTERAQMERQAILSADDIAKQQLILRSQYPEEVADTAFAQWQGQHGKMLDLTGKDRANELGYAQVGSQRQGNILDHAAKMDANNIQRQEMDYRRTPEGAILMGVAAGNNMDAVDIEGLTSKIQQARALTGVPAVSGQALQPGVEIKAGGQTGGQQAPAPRPAETGVVPFKRLLMDKPKVYKDLEVRAAKIVEGGGDRGELFNDLYDQLGEEFIAQNEDAVYQWLTAHGANAQAAQERNTNSTWGQILTGIPDTAMLGIAHGMDALGGSGNVARVSEQTRVPVDQRFGRMAETKGARKQDLYEHVMQRGAARQKK